MRQPRPEHLRALLSALGALGALFTLGATSSVARADDAPAVTYRDVCPLEAGGRRCDVKMRTDANGRIKYDSSPVGGYAPADLQSAYGLTPTDGAGKIVALFAGGSDYTNAESDLGVYRAQYGLPPCTAANGCFIKIDEHGGTSYPPAGADETEQSLDIEMASASCPACKIMLIEGPDLDVALATANARGVSAFSFSVLVGYGGGTGSACQNLGFNNLSGILVTGALGDTAYPGARDYIPATCQGALAVGGTTLNKATNARGWTETTWSGTGSGCSPYVAKPPWQTDTGCSMRMEADVAAVADPGTGLSVYNTQGGGGWGIVGGTSAASPIVAGSLASLGIANGHFTPAWVWQNGQSFFDITSGNNGTCSGSPSYFCTAGTAYDGPTGWGTPNGNLLKSALPPGSGGTDAGASCATPTGSYSQSCTACVVGVRSGGCELACQSCGKIDGTQNPGPVLALPCVGDVVNNDGVLECDGPPPAPDSGAPDAGARDASIPDGSAPLPPHLEGGIVLADSGSSPDDATVSDDASLAVAPSAPASGGSGCGCVAAGEAESALPNGGALLGVGVVAAWRSRRRRNRREGAAARGAEPR